MKKYLCLFLVLAAVFIFVGCQSAKTGQGDNILEGSLEDVVAAIYETAEVDDYFKEYIKEGLQVTEITAEYCSYHLGTEVDFAEAIASEPVIMPSAYELCLVRAKEGADIEQIKTAIKENVDPQKWICVGVDPEKIIVDNIGDIIILIMSDDQGEALHNAFLALAK